MQKRTLTIIAALGLLACIILMVMMNTYLEPLKTLPKLRDEIALRHAELLEEGTRPGVRARMIEEDGSSVLGYVVEIRPRPEILADARACERAIGAVALTVFESEWRHENLTFVEVVVTSEERPLRRRLTLDDARAGRTGAKVDGRRRPTD